jgi:hypothetical protein
MRHKPDILCSSGFAIPKHLITDLQSDIIELPNLLLIAGSGRNTGKTTTACNVISENSGLNEVVAIKVSPHFHRLTESLKILKEAPGLVIAEEKDRISGKDSSRFLRAGAIRSYYVQGNDMQMPLLAEWMRLNIAKNTPVVCESGGIGQFIEPGGAIYLHTDSDKEFPKWNFDYRKVVGSFLDIKLSVKWNNKRWII